MLSEALVAAIKHVPAEEAVRVAVSEELDKVQVPALIKQHTRNYAKRQLTWMRRYQNVHYLNPLATESLLSQALDRIG